MFSELGRVLGKIAGYLVAAQLKIVFKLFEVIAGKWPEWGKYISDLVDEQVLGVAIKITPLAPDAKPEVVAKWYEDTLHQLTGLDLSPFTGKAATRKSPIAPIIIGILLAILATVLGSLLYPYISSMAGEKLRQAGMYQSRAALIPLDILREAKLRGLIKDEDVQYHLSHAGYEDWIIEVFEKLFWAVPGIADVIRFAVREVYLPERRAELLSVPTPPDTYEWGEKVGLDRRIVDDYWAAHWVLPPAEQLNAFLYRTDVTKFTREDWMRYMKYLDYEPLMIPNYEKIIYAPYTRVDVRRMWDVGVVTDDEVYKNYLWLGYDEEHAKRMTLWTKVYTLSTELRARYSKGWITAEQVKQELLDAGMPAERVGEWVEKIVKKEEAARTEKERDLTRTDIIKAVKLGEFTQSEAASLLVAMGYDESEAELIIALGLASAKGELRDLTTANIVTAYRYKIIDRAMAKEKLVGADYSPDSAEIILKIEDEKQAAAAVDKSRERDLTPSQITRAFKANIISSDDCVEYLLFLGYTNWEVNVILRLEFVEPIVVRQLNTSNVLSAYRHNVFDRDTAKSMLVEMKYLEADAEVLLITEDKKRVTVGRELTTANILAAYRNIVIYRWTATARLVGAGYSEDDAETLLKTEEAKLTDEERLKLFTANVLGAYKEKIVDRAKAKSQLVGLGYSDADAEAMLREVEAIT